MKILTLVAMLLPFCMISQTVLYKYDNAGNRYLRNVLVLKSDSSSNLAIIDVADNLKYVDTMFVNYSENLNGINITIYPNPNGGQFNVDVSENGIAKGVSLFIHTISGVLVYKDENITQITNVDIRDRENGTYLLTFVVAGEKSVWKIIKQ